MTQTVVGLFPKLSDARTAETKLIESGFARDMIDVSPGTTASAQSGNASSADEPGAVKRFFSDLFGSEPDANRFAEAAGRSEAVVSVHATSAEQAQQAARILDDAGAMDADDDSSLGRDADDNAGGSVKVIKEELQVGKRTVETGGARLRSRIVERVVSQDVRLKHERVLVTRRSVDRVANAADLAAFREGQVEIVEHAEVPVVSKEARVVEEVSLHKEQGERTETVRDTVRGTEVEVEEIEPSTSRTPTRH